MKKMILVMCLAFAPRVIAQEPVLPSSPVVVTIGQATIMVAPDRAFVTVAAGRSIDRVIRIQKDGVPDLPRPMLRMAAAEQMASTPIAPSTVEIHARVTLTASLK